MDAGAANLVTLLFPLPPGVQRGPPEARQLCFVFILHGRGRDATGTNARATRWMHSTFCATRQCR